MDRQHVTRERAPRPGRALAFLVVTADDFGLSPGTNEGILRAHREGIVTCAALMANMPSAHQAVRLWREQPTLELGLHFTLTAGCPVAPPEQVPTLVDRAGRFRPLPSLLARLALGRVAPSEVERELRAQLARAERLGATLAFLNGHHHVHAHPLVLPSVLRVARERGLAVRSPWEPFREALASHGPRPRAAITLARLWGVRWLVRGARLAMSSRGVATTEHFRGLALGLGFDTRRLVALLDRLPGGTTELMCHPGVPDDEARRYTGFVAGRLAELEALTHPSVRQRLVAAGVALVGFRWLSDRGG
ncbi:MAG TPA: ChbG/HpnK family deacetylase [Chloroflexota bacterium]